MPPFDKSGRLRKRAEFVSISTCGSKIYLPDFIIIKAKSTYNWSRIGITVSRKVGNSVTRNRIKRLLREFFRNNRELFLIADYNIIARKGAVNLVYHGLCQELADGLCRIGQQNSQ